MGERLSRYGDGLRVGDARQVYFDDNGFGDGGYGDRWVKLQAGPVPLFFPNSAARVAAVRRHDIHHVLTGYDTSWVGEAEIGGWEIGSGCGSFWAAWFLNLQALLVGMMLAPGAVLRGFAWGRRSRNLYQGEFDDRVLDETLGALRARLGLDEGAPEPSPADRAGLAAWCLVALPLFLAGILPVLAPIALVVWLGLRLVG